MSEIEAPKFTVTLVHGTFAKGAAWTRRPTSVLWGELEKTFGGAVHVTCCDWSGDNNMVARLQGADELVGHVRRLKADFPLAKHFIVAHSHGGNVALYAAYEEEVDGIATLATPFISMSVRNPLLLNGDTIRKGLFGLLMLITYALHLIFDPSLIDYNFGSWWFFFVVFMVVVLSSLLSSVFSALIKPVLQTAPDFAELFTARVPPNTSFCAFRVAGDEASLVLASSQLISWLSAVFHRDFAAKRETEFLKRPLRDIAFSGKWWRIFSILAIAGAVGTALQYFYLFDLSWISVFFGACVLVLLIIISLLHTTLWDGWVRGIALLLLTLSSLLVMILTGTSPPHGRDEQQEDKHLGHVDKLLNQSLAAAI
jgi:hypothetical protein